MLLGGLCEVAHSTDGDDGDDGAGGNDGDDGDDGGDRFMAVMAMMALMAMRALMAMMAMVAIVAMTAIMQPSAIYVTHENLRGSPDSTNSRQQPHCAAIKRSRRTTRQRAKVTCAPPCREGGLAAVFVISTMQK